MGELELDKDAKMILLNEDGKIEVELNPIEISFTKSDEDYKGVNKWRNQILY